MREHCKISEIQAATGLSPRSICRTLKASNCPKEKRKLPGICKPHDHYPIAGLPDLWQSSLYELRARKLQEEEEAAELAEENRNNLPVPVGNAIVPRSEIPLDVFARGIPRKKRDEALLKHRLVSLYRSELKAASAKHGNKMNIQERFVYAYNLGESGPYPDIFKVVGPVTLKTLNAWDVELAWNGNNPDFLADRRGYHRTGATIVSEEQMKILVSILLSPNRKKISEGIREARKKWEDREIEVVPCDNTYRNAIAKYKRANIRLWTFCRSGAKEAADRYGFHISRDYSKIKVGDIVSADGHRWNLRMIDPWSGRDRRMTLILFMDMASAFPLGWEISLNEDTGALTTACYRACLTLGMKPKVLYCDNGKAFRKKVYNSISDFRQSKSISIWERAGIGTIYAWPYHGQSKPVERMFSNVAEFERACLSYSGTSIEEKPPRFHRNEKLHKRLHEHITGGKLPTVEDVHKGFTAWLDEYIKRPQKGHLKGRTPLEVFQEGRGPGLSPEELHELKIALLPSVIRKITRDGIKLPWAENRYYHKEMYGKVDHEVEVRYDQWNPSTILVFDRNGGFLFECEQKLKVHPAAYQLGTIEDQEEFQRQIELKRGQEKAITGPIKELLDNQILPETKRRHKALGLGDGERPLLPEPSRKRTTPQKPAPQNDEWTVIDVTPEEMAEFERRDREGTAIILQHQAKERMEFEQLLASSERAQRYDELLRLCVQGVEISGNHGAFMCFYEMEKEYMKHKQQWEERGFDYQNGAQSGKG